MGMPVGIYYPFGGEISIKQDDSTVVRYRTKCALIGLVQRHEFQ